MKTKVVRLLIVVLIFLVITGCSPKPKDQGAQDANPNPSPDLTQPVSTCTPTDQDQYVWRPKRLRLLQPCVRAVGTVMEISEGEVDGDIHIHIQLDAPYEGLLTAGNKQLNNYLVVEAVCQYIPPMIEALLPCASDPDPFPGPFPQIGDHIWVEGRYVLDLGHFSWAELHPLYRWGITQP